jgi:hypothetical protein
MTYYYLQLLYEYYRNRKRNYFYSICSAQHLTHGKPHPQVFINCAEVLNTQTEGTTITTTTTTTKIMVNR